MEILLEELTRENIAAVRAVDRSDIPETFVDGAGTILELTEYAVAHRLLGHTFAVKKDAAYIGVLLLGEALAWETDPPEMKAEPFYRLMGFYLDRRYRGQGIGGQVLETAIGKVYNDFGVRPIALGCHRENQAAARFYERHGFHKTAFTEGDDIYYIRPATLPEKSGEKESVDGGFCK